MIAFCSHIFYRSLRYIYDLQDMTTKSKLCIKVFIRAGQSLVLRKSDNSCFHKLKPKPLTVHELLFSSRQDCQKHYNRLAVFRIRQTF